jgi:hypothetical protein
MEQIEMIKKLILVLASAPLLVLTATADAKPSKPVTPADSVSLNGNAANLPGDFLQTFSLTTSNSYNDSGVISVFGDSFTTLSLKVEGGTFNGSPVPGQTVAATFSDSAATTFNLLANTTYTVTVFGKSKLAGASYSLNATGGFVSGNAGPVVAVPEPETYAMFLAGLGIMGAMVRRRKGTKAA